MVSKITLFEPHFDGAQIGPARIDTEEATAPVSTKASKEHAAEDTADSSSRFSKVRTVLALTTATAFLFAGVIAWRRFKSGSEMEEEIPDATIEERSMDDLTAE